MIYTYIDLIRGDDCYVPIQGILPSTCTVNIHLRENSDSSSYYILSVVGNCVYIPSTVSINLSGHYEFDIECIIAGTTITIQHTDIDFIPDVTRLYGDIQPILNQDLERVKIIAREYLVKDDNGILSPLNNTRFSYIQNLPEKVWTISHGLNKYPSVVVCDSAGTFIEGKLRYIDFNTVEAVFNVEFSGRAELN